MINSTRKGRKESKGRRGNTRKRKKALKTVPGREKEEAAAET